MKFITRLVLHVLVNAIALFVAATFVDGVTVTGGWITLIVLGAILTALNTLLRPVIKLFLGPLIVITFGLFSIVVNALMLFILDIVSDHLTISGYLPLLIATLIIGIVNVVLGFLTHGADKK